MGVDALGAVARREDLPVSAGRLHHPHLDVLVLVVAKLDTPAALVDARADDAVVHLTAVADHVERLAHLDAHLLVARRVIDAVLADELLRAAAIVLVDPHHAGRQRHAEAVGFGVLEL